MARRAHLVGTWPGRNPEHAMELALSRLAPYLDRLSDGETGDRQRWSTPAVEKFRGNPDVELVHDGDYTDYDNLVLFRVRDGVRLDPDNIRLHYALAFENSFPSFLVLRERYGRPDLRFQVGIPMPIDIAQLAFGDVALTDPTILEPCTEAAAREIRRIHAQGGSDVVFQLETCIALLAVAAAPDEEQAAVADRMVGNFLDVAAQSPDGARFGVHLCLGDFHHRASGNMRDVRPLVLVANAIAAGWPPGRVLEFVHAPFAAAAEPPIPEESFYAPLADLTLPPETRFIAGFLHESLDTDAHLQLLARIERLTGREVDIAAACGLGRRDTDEEAFEQMRETTAILESSAAP